MKRDLELVREILLGLDRVPLEEELRSRDLDGYDESVVAAHMQLLVRAGLLEAELIELDGFPGPLMARAFGLTWKGHELLAAIRSDRVWQQLKEEFAEQEGDLPLSLVQELGLRYLRQLIGRGTWSLGPQRG